MRTIETLKHEHRVIEIGLDVLEVMADRLTYEEFVPTDRIQALLAFFRMFADWCHDAKEEGVLFPALKQLCIHGERSTISVMLFEHREARALLHRMSDAVPQLANRAARTQFVQAAHSYVQLLRDHIIKEDNVLFPVAESLLADQDTQLSEACELNEYAVGEGLQEGFYQLIRDLEQEFLGENATHEYACVTA